MNTPEDDEEYEELKGHHIGDLIKEVLADYNIEAAKRGNPIAIWNDDNTTITFSPSAPTRHQQTSRRCARKAHRHG